MEFIILFKFEWNSQSANSGDPDQMPHSTASDLGLHYLPMSHKKGDRLRCKPNIYVS